MTSQDILLIDVREKDEVAQGAIPSSVNIPLSVFVDALRSSPEDFQRVHGFPKPRKDQDMIFYCRSGKRSATAADSAKDNGFTKWVYSAPRFLLFQYRLCHVRFDSNYIPSLHVFPSIIVSAFVPLTPCIGSDPPFRIKNYSGSWLDWVKQTQENDYNL
jgi:rhodanese-related sulfurtransferase